jgi:hypothetical protein
MRSDLPFAPFVCLLLIFLVLLIRRLWHGGKIILTARNRPEHRAKRSRLLVSRAIPRVRRVREESSRTRKRLGRLHPV